MPAVAVQVKTEPAVFSGRCPKCGSAEMWSEGATFGCDDCGAQFCTEDGKPVSRLARRDA